VKKGTSVFSLFSSKKDDHHGNNIERLVKYLAAMLEYDEPYFSCLTSSGIQRSMLIHYNSLRILGKSE
jgi:hypothetical protein